MDETGIEEIPSEDFSFEAEMPETFSNPAVSDIESADTALPADVDAGADIETEMQRKVFRKKNIMPRAMKLMMLRCRRVVSLPEMW